MQNIKTIIFDLGGVYFTAGTKIAKEKIISLTQAPASIVDEIFEAQPHKEGFWYRNGQISQEEFWQAAKSKLGITTTQVTEIRELWHSSYTPIAGMKELVQNVRKQYKVVAFSGNIKERIEYLNHKYDLLQDFDDFVLSYEIGYSKLEPEFFKILIQKINCQADEAILIDDNQKFVNLSIELGFHGLVFKNIEQIKNDLIKSGVIF
ncbi:MAG: hypothetical protein QG603_272 [Patescibacteria group bacterium]|nr:hypothetical protein [Patescibacteria group bacterium]MDQ5970495.1 hypothetical protein [Patescibacteria group bacterium]